MAANAVQRLGTLPSPFVDMKCHTEECAALVEKAKAGIYDKVVNWGYLSTPNINLKLIYKDDHSSTSESQAITTSTSVSAAPAPTSTSESSRFMCHLSTFQDLAAKNIAAVMDEMVGRMSDLTAAGWKLYDSKTTEPVPESTNAHASDRRKVENSQNVPSFARPHSKHGQDKTISIAKAKDKERAARDLAFYHGRMVGSRESEKECARRMAVKKLFNSFKAQTSASIDDKTSAAESDVAKLPHHTFKCQGCHLGFQTPVQDATRAISDENEVQEGAQTGPRTATENSVVSEISGHNPKRKQTPLKETISGSTVHHLKCMFIGFASSLFVLAAYIGMSAEAPKAKQSRPCQEEIKLRNTVLDQQGKLVRKDTTIRTLEMALRKEVFNKTVASREVERKDETIVSLRKEAGELRAQLVQRQQEFDQLRGKVVQAQREHMTTTEVFELREAMRKRNIEMNELHDQLRSTQARVERLATVENVEAHASELATKEQTVSELTERLRGVTAAFDSVKGYCARVNTELESRTKTITSVTKAAKTLQKTLASKDTELQRNEETIISLKQKLQVEADNNLQSRDISYRIMKENSDLRNQIKDLARKRVCAQEDLRWAKAKIEALEEQNELSKGQWEKMGADDGEDDVDENDMQEVEDDENEGVDENFEVIDGSEPDDLEN